MSEPRPLEIFLDEFTAGTAEGDATREALPATLRALAGVAAELSGLIAEGELEGRLAEAVGENVDGDTQKALDVQADKRFVQALEGAPVAVLGSEERDTALSLNPEAPLAVTLDPLDGSSNIATNVSVGSIFGIYPVLEAGESAERSILQPGRKQLAAGFVVYGPQTTMTLTLGAGTHVFTLSRKRGGFWLTGSGIAIPPEQPEYAINGSNARHWDAAIRTYIEECKAGKDGPRGRDYNTRWVASLVADAFRIFSRGGIFLYPGDDRPRYRNGRLRIVYEANPISFLVEQAGGKASDGRSRILDIQPEALHQRVPLVFGSTLEVERVATLYGND